MLLLTVVVQLNLDFACSHAAIIEPSGSTQVQSDTGRTLNVTNLACAVLGSASVSECSSNSPIACAATDSIRPYLIEFATAVTRL